MPQTEDATFKLAQVISSAPVYYYPEVDSTNNVALELAREGAAHLTAVVAERQTAGRGRQGRVWQTFPGAALAVSLVVRDVPPTLPLVACLALREAVVDITGQHPHLKWPNDLLWQGRKLAGVLTEGYQAGQDRFYILGIGINVNTPPEGIPADVPAGTLAQLAGHPLSREVLLSRLLERLDDNLLKLRAEGFGTFVSTYRQVCCTVGQTVTWQAGDNQLTGSAVDITADGSLVLETPTGQHLCHSGEIIVPAV